MNTAATPRTLDEYLAALSDDQRSALQKLRKVWFLRTGAPARSVRPARMLMATPTGFGSCERKAPALTSARLNIEQSRDEHEMSKDILQQIADGRTNLVFEYVFAGHAAKSVDPNGTSLISWCAYYGDVSAIRFLLANGEELSSLGDNLDLNGAAFHGHWQLCMFLIENGGDVNRPLADTGETPLHAALCKSNSPAQTHVIRVLLGAGANPNSVTKSSAKTGGFMRDCRTKGETPLHRAAAFGTDEAVQLLVDEGAILDAKDQNGDSPLSWASWHLRHVSILRKLCYGPFRIRPDYGGMDANLLGQPHGPPD